MITIEESFEAIAGRVTYVREGNKGVEMFARESHSGKIERDRGKTHGDAAVT